MGPAATASGLLVFLLTCFSDPGTITADNVALHAAAHAHDRLLFPPGKRCASMRLPAPARSKFCRVTNRRVGRFDHYCIWMNNAIGENNYRYFLAFLAWHALLCAYGAALMLAIIAGEARGMHDIKPEFSLNSTLTHTPTHRCPATACWTCTWSTTEWSCRYDLCRARCCSG